MAERKERIKQSVKTRVAPDVAAAQAEGTIDAPIGTPENPSTQVLTLANVITFCRFLLTIVFLYLFVTNGSRQLALACYAIAAVTDFLDGMVARATQTVSWTGKIMDPIMDRVLLFTGVLGLMISGELPVWMAVVVVGRDLSLIAGSVWLQKFQRRPMDVILPGKMATAFLMTGFTDMLIAAPVVQGLGIANVDWLPGLNAAPVAVGIYLIYLGIIFSIFTAVIYYYDGLKIRRKVLDERRRQEM